jgi:hypothetical protein
MARSMDEELTPIFIRMAEALVEATPERWSSAVLELVVPQGHLGTGLAHSISNPDFPREIIVPTEELLEATRELELVSERHEDSWDRCVFRIEQGSAGKWRYVAEFDR